jgi:copper homeostasis protein
MIKKVNVEVCVDSVESAIEAQNGGADRVELCDNLMEGGTTPSFGSIKVARRSINIKLHVIIRPRGGDFLYSETEFEVMRQDIETAKSLGVDGVVIGLLDCEGGVDLPRTAELVGLSRPMSVTFHRAFDVCSDPFDAVDQLAALGVDRILTSGQEATAVEGAELIAKLVEHAGERITIMACGNLTERNIDRIINLTGVGEVHFTGFRSVGSDMRFRNERVFMGGTLRPPEYDRAVTSSEIVRNVIDRIRG